MKNREPTSFHEALDRLAYHLDNTDRISRAYAKSVGSSYDTDDRAQQTLRRVAQWIEANPTATVAELDAYFLESVSVVAADMDRSIPIHGLRRQ